MKRSLSLWVGLTLLGLVAACGRFGGAGDQPAPTALPLISGPTSELRVRLVNRGAVAALRPVARNGDVVTWRTGDNITLSFQEGLIVASRGLGDDAMSIDNAGSRQASQGAAEGGYYPLFYSTLTPLFQIGYVVFQCQVTDQRSETVTVGGQARSTLRTNETCVSQDLSIENTYWRGRDGVMWKSRQWLGVTTGYIETERLAR